VVFTGEGYIVVNNDANTVRAKKQRRNSEEITNGKQYVTV
jgi:hypothetical protein